MALYVKVTYNITAFRYGVATKLIFTTETTMSYFKYVTITQNSSSKVWFLESFSSSELTTLLDIRDGLENWQEYDSLGSNISN